MAFKNLDEIKKAASHSQVVNIDRSDIRLLLDNIGLNSLLFTDPFSKLCFTSCAVSEFLKKGDVVYIDLDTVFTAYVKNGIFSFTSHPNKLTIYLPGRSEFEEMLTDICSGVNSHVELIVMDSLNSFYHLYQKIKIGPLNHLLSSYVLLLLNQGSKVGTKLLVTSMMRHKKKAGWVLGPAGKRLIDSSSSIILKPELVDGTLSINFITHHEHQISSKKFVLPAQQIPLHFELNDKKTCKKCNCHY